MLISVNGGLGSGKSLFLTIYAIHTKKPVVANFQLFDIEYENLDIYKLIKGGYSDCVILIDEVYQYLDSRNSMNELNKLFSYFLFQSRKKNIELFICAQIRGTIDVRFRKLTDYVIHCAQDREGFHYILTNPVNVSENAEVLLTHRQAKSYFKFFDTNEIIMDKQPSKKFMNPEEKLKLVENLATEMVLQYKKEYRENNPKKKRIKKITRPWVNIWALKHQVDSSIITHLYNYSKAYFDQIN
jgi:hypothetical protein